MSYDLRVLQQVRVGLRRPLVGSPDGERPSSHRYFGNAKQGGSIMRRKRWIDLFQRWIPTPTPARARASMRARAGERPRMLRSRRRRKTRTSVTSKCSSPLQMNSTSRKRTGGAEMARSRCCFTAAISRTRTLSIRSLTWQITALNTYSNFPSNLRKRVIEVATTVLFYDRGYRRVRGISKLDRT